jgi:hypothetical protein
MLSELKRNHDLRSELKVVCNSIDFSDSHSHMPSLEFQYTLHDNLLTIEGPFQSFHSVDPYVITYIPKSGFITFNGEVMDGGSFKHLHKTVKEVYRKLLKRENLIKDIQTARNTIGPIVVRSGSGSGGSSDYEKSGSGNSERRRNYDVNTDIVYASSDSCSSSSSSRDRDRCDD